MRIALGIVARASTVYVITDRRVAAVGSLGARQRLLWVRPLAELRAEATPWWPSVWRLVVGRHEVHVRGDPRAVLAQVRREAPPVVDAAPSPPTPRACSSL